MDETKNIIELFYIDNADEDKLKSCGFVQTLVDLNEKRISANTIDVSGQFTRVRLDAALIDKLFMQGFLHCKSQRHPFVAIVTDYDNNAKVIISCIWLTNIDYTFSAENVYILENVKWEAESIRSEKLDGTPFTMQDAIEHLIRKNVQETFHGIKSQFRIESGGTVMETKLFFNDELVSLVQNIKWEIGVDDIYPKATFTVLNVPVNLKVDEKHIEKIIKDIE